MKDLIKLLCQKACKDADGIIITSDLNRRYFTGFRSSAGILLAANGYAKFIVDFRYIEAARANIKDIDVELQKSGNEYFKQISDFFKANGANKVLVETETMTLSEYKHFCQKLPTLEVVADDCLSRAVSEIRRIKSPQELEQMKKAQDITDKAFLHICDFIKPGLTEREVALELEYTMKKLGADGLAFDSIVASGINSSMPHAVPCDKKIQNGDFVTMDFGASYNGYCSDMTRTVAVGAISEEQKSLYNTVLQSQLLALDGIKPGMICSAADKIARDYIYQNGYEGCFGHSLGHSVGLFIHEEPRFSELCDDVLKPGTIMTVEPGIYLEGKFGVRIEDMIYITENGFENLTASEKKLITL